MTQGSQEQRPEALEAAGLIVEERFPDAELAVLTGSVARGRATATSDLDIVVVLDGPPAPYRETLRAHGWLVELFVESREALTQFYADERAAGRCTLAHMVAYGVVLAGPADGDLQRAARGWVAAGPPPLTTAELDRRRYTLTSELDDLRDATDPDERDAIAAQVAQTTADLALRSAGRWAGTGKWLFRRLAEFDEGLARDVAQARRAAIGRADVDPLCAVAGRVLDGCGGPLAEGYAIDEPSPG
jgi:predicted nucleotidyltransferase